RERLGRLGGPPETGEDQRLDPGLFRPHPNPPAPAPDERGGGGKGPARPGQDPPARAPPPPPPGGRGSAAGGDSPPPQTPSAPPVAAGGSTAALRARRLADYLLSLAGRLATGIGTSRPPATQSGRADEPRGFGRH